MDYYKRPIKEALNELGASELGLSPKEAQARLQKYGPNIIKVHSKPLWKIILQPFLSVFMAVLFVAALISFWEQAFVDGVIILVVIAISAVMDYAQQYSTSRILRALRKQEAHSVTVLRKGKEELIDTTLLVPGDIIRLEEGDKIPADCRVIKAESLRVDESLLTGESLPITKDAASLHADKELYEQTNMLFQGTFLVGGTATAVVTSTANATEFGKMAALSAEGFEKSPVEERIDKIISRIIIAVAVIAVLIFALSLVRGNTPAEALRYTIAIAVSAVPEGLPVAISVVLAMGMRQLAKRQAIVRHSAAMESIGVITTIATDKTGTLTKNQLTVQELWSPKRGHKELNAAIAGATLPQGASKVFDPLDKALLAYINQQKTPKLAAPCKVFAFEHELAMSGALFHYGEEFNLYVKGSPEAILHHSAITENEHEQALAALHHMTGLGFRVIACAHTTLKKELPALRDIKPSSLHFDGFVAIADTLRRDAKPAIKRAQAAGISVRMITGDHFETAFHIGKQLGLVTAREQVFDSRGMDRLNDEQLAQIIQRTYVFSRVTPERKHRLLTVLKQSDITAMTGDGVNDVPALTNAHVGIAMGSGSDIAKDAGDILLLNDSFKSIVDGVAIGRTTYANIRRMVTYLIGTNLGEVFVSMIALMFGTPVPLVPIQILWINLVTDTTTVIPLGLEPEHANIMKSPPAPPKTPLLRRFVVGQIVVVALAVAAVTLSFYYNSLHAHNLEYARTIAFYTMAVAQWGVVLGLRATLSPVWTILKTPSPVFWIGLAISVAMQLAAMFTPLGSYLHIIPISTNDLLAATLAAILIPLAVLEIYKAVGRAIKAKV